ncbi:MAG: AraC family transcriptional regulator [Eubacteriales bacterium]|nr:AraC family transcriptional regulator [Eubacteriales bacterium]
MKEKRKGRMETFAKKIKNISRSRYRIRILLAFFAVAVLAIGFLDVAVFRGLSEQIRADSEKDTREMLENMTSSYENQVVQYQDQAQLLYRNLNVKAYLATEGREDSHIDTIYESMKALAGNMTGISSVILFYKEEILASYDTGMVMTSAKEEVLKKIQETTTDKEILYVWTDNKKSRRQMAVFWSDREKLYGPSIYGVALIVSMDAVQEKVVPWNQKAENPIYIFHESGELAAAQKNGYEEKLSDVFAKIQEQEPDFGAWYENIDGKKCTVAYVRPEDSRFLTVRIQEVPASQERTQQALRTILISTVLGMGLSLLIVWVVSGWMYRPLGEIFRNILEMAQASEDEEKGELELVSDAMADVNENMNLLKNQLRNHAVIRFLRQGTSESEIDRNIFDFPENGPERFLLMTLRYYLEDWKKNDALAADLPEIAKKQGVGIKAYRAYQGEIVLLFYESRPEGEYLLDQSGIGEEWAEAILDALEAGYGLKGCIGMAGCKTLSELPEAYKTAELLTEYHILSKEIRVISEASLEQKRQGSVSGPQREQLLRFVKEGREEDLPACVHGLLQNLASYRIAEAQDYLKALVAEVIRLSESVSGERQVQYESYLEDFLTNQIFIGQVDIEEWLCQLFLQVQAQIREGRQSNASRIMGDVAAYVADHYQDCDLSVESVAERYGLSVSYFSKLFNQYTGKTFPDYVNQLRLQKAKELLLADPGMPVGEIAELVGFHSSSYFSAAFRKYYGVSPSQIRKRK